ncbi:DUF2255 family protein [Myxococcota bacterium]|nr:DUF2255 family protein [Myxococcota bacterium]
MSVFLGFVLCLPRVGGYFLYMDDDHKIRSSGFGVQLIVSLMALLFASSASGDYPEWNDYVDVDVIEVITQDEDGGERETKVWFVLLGGEPYLRTSGSRWLANLRRDPDFKVRIEGTVYEARAEEIEGEAIVEKVDIASKRKYGFSDRVIGFFRSSRPDILRVLPRTNSSP